jgi:hypothetical protein
MEVIDNQFTQLASEETIIVTALAVQARGIQAQVLENKAQALEKIQTMIPVGASVMAASSKTLDEVGFTNYFHNGKHGWQNLKDKVVHEENPVVEKWLRKESSMADFYLGSVHALSKNGEMVFASASGSQLSAYCYNCQNVIWIVGTQKITRDLARAIERVTEYCLPAEDEHQRKLGNPYGSYIGKLLIFQKEASFLHRNLHLLLVKEKLGV